MVELPSIARLGSGSGPLPVNRDEVLARQAAWKRFNEWEAARRSGLVNFELAWDWYRGAWTLARAWGSVPREPLVDMARILDLRTLRDRLARVRCRT